MQKLRTVTRSPNLRRGRLDLSDFRTAFVLMGVAATSETPNPWPALDPNVNAPKTSGPASNGTQEPAKGPDGEGDKGSKAGPGDGKTGPGGGNPVMQAALMVAALLNSEPANSIRTDGSGSSGGIPGGRCETCSRSLHI